MDGKLGRVGFTRRINASLSSSFHLVVRAVPLPVGPAVLRNCWLMRVLKSIVAVGKRLKGMGKSVSQ